jgi:hypothetical protein
MKRKQFLRYMGAAFGAAAFAPFLTGCNDSDDSSTSDTTTDGTVPDTTLPPGLSADEVAALQFMREEEKLAHDVYVYLYGVWGEIIFDNISASETSHTEAIRLLLVKYGLDDPAAGKPAGVFTNPDLQALYTALIAKGSTSKIDALTVGATIEEKDIKDINTKKTITDEADILAVYDSLLCGSRNHLRSFNQALLALGVTYVPQFITQAEWDAIANSPLETTCATY